MMLANERAIYNTLNSVLRRFVGQSILLKYLGILILLSVFKTGISQNVNLISVERNVPASQSTKYNSFRFKVTFDEEVLSVDTSDFVLTGSIAGNSTITGVSSFPASVFYVDATTSSTASGNLGVAVKGVGVAGSNNIISDNLVLNQQSSADLQVTNSKVFGQSFIPTISGKLHKIIIKAGVTHNYSGSGTMVIRSGDGLGGTILATEPVQMTSSLGEKTYWFSNPPTLNSGTQYTMHFSFPASSSTIAISAQVGANYSGGILYQPGALSQADLYFKLYMGTGPVKPLSTTVPSVDEKFQFVYLPKRNINFIKRQNPLATNITGSNVVFGVQFDTVMAQVSADDFSLNTTLGGTIDSVKTTNEKDYSVYASGISNATASTIGLNIKGVGGASGTNNILSKIYGDSATVDLTHTNDYLNQSKIGQTFKAKTNKTLRRVTIYPKSGNHTFNGTAILRITSGDDLLSGSSNIYTKVVPIHDGTDARGQSFEISPAINVVAGNTYSIVFENFTGSGSRALEASTNGGYTDGHVIFTGYNTPSHGNFDLKIKIFEEGFGDGAELGTTSPTTNETYTMIPTLATTVNLDSNISCNGLTDGGLTANPSGAPGPYTYAWSNGATTKSITGIAAGVYTVTVTTSTGGTQTASNSNVITEPAILVAAVAVDSSPSCNGYSDGGVTASATGGTGAYSYSWSNAATNASITGVAAGTYTVTITDSKGCTSTSSKNISEPTALVASISSQTNVSCNGYANGAATASASGGTSSYTYVWNTGETNASETGMVAGVYSVTITDSEGCTDSASVNLTTMVDVTAPIITVCASTPGNITANNFCQGTAPDLTGSVTATDNCTASPTITQSPASGATLGLGTTTITLIATDGAGNTATCTVNQTVIDATAPTITVCASTPGNIIANNFCQGTAPNLTGSVTATDNCTSSPTITQSPASGATLGLGTTTITLTATDGSGNTATCTVNQTVIDATAPTITVCASTSNISANSFCQGTAPDLTGSVTATDNCTSSPTITQSPASGATLGLGTTTITLTATDGSGNTATCTVNQTVIDNTAPTITVCASTPSNIIASNSCTGTAPNLTGSVTATDNCTSSPTITQSPASGATLGLGTTTITLTATDGSGNTATCTVNQTVIDNTAPTITVCASTPSNISANSFCQGTAVDLTGSVTATDNCSSSPTITQSPASGATLGLGTTTITLTATDGSGNTATCTVNQTVVDDTAPTITVCASTPGAITANNLNQAPTPGLTGSVTATDNCSSSPTITQSPAAGATLGLGTTTITLIATDGSGNTATCTVNQTVISPFSASISAQTHVSCNGLSDGSLTASSTNGTSPYSYAWSNGGVTATITSLSAGTYTVTMTDNLGLTTTASSTITEPAVLVAATVVDSNITCNGYSDGGASASATGGTAPYSYAWSNGATIASITGVTAGSYNVTITDANGCTDMANVVVTEPAVLTSNVVIDSNVTCNSYSNGGATASGAGGTGAYAYAWSNGATTASITGVVAGTFTVTITDANGCTASNNGAITEPVSITASIAVDSNVSCNGLSDGGLTVSATGGTGAYIYGWGTGASTASITGLAAGNYSVVITDANGCSGFTTGTVTEPVVLTSNVTVDSNVTCNGFSNGGITTTATGGTTPYSYAWSNGSMTASITGVVAGSYSVTVTDANGCTSVSNGVITEPALLVASTVVDSNVTCNGYLNGGATASATGGTGTYTYAWDNGASTASITGIAAGTHTVTVTDANGCTDTNSVTITEPASIVASIVVDSNVSCNGLSDGGVTVSVSGGTGAYVYAWGTGANAASITGLAAGSYSVAITDANGCSGSAFGTVTEPIVLTSNVIVDSNVTCNGFSHGGATVSVNGGTTPYTYSWSNGGMTAAITGIPAGSYTVTVTDANGCTSSGSITITEPSVLTSNVVVDSNATCNGYANGGLSASAAGGTTPYTFVWNNSAITASITGVVAGSYTVTVTDANGCTSVSNRTVTEPTLLVASTIVDSNVTCNGLLDGGTTASATGGTGTYTYVWNNSAVTTSITGVAAGSYTVTVTDANGCTATNTAIVTEPAVLVAHAVVDSNVTCYNGTDGGASVQVTGGTTMYSYVWDNMSVTSAITGLTMGTYEVTVTDANGCSDTSSVSITEPAPIVINLGNDTSICSGGSLTLDPGAGFHSYLWSDNSTNATLNVNSSVAGANDYAVTVTNTDGCKGIDTINVNVFVATGVTISGANDLCASEVDTLKASSGFISYLWNTSATTTDILVDANTLSGGTHSYTVTATDSNGCISDDMVTFQVFDPVVVDLGSDTSIVWIDGITTEYTLDAGAGFSSYLWSDLSTTSQTYVVNLTNMGNVSVTVTDGNGCKGSDTVFVDFVLDVPVLEAAKVRIYPNPAHDVVRVEVEGNISGEMEMSLLSMDGKLIEKQVLNSADMQNQVQFDVQHLARGVYFIRMIHGTQQEIMRLVIQ